ncbi:MAG: hypothetical protein WCD79_03560 [Chthoniobacteraceae bacterium]
MTVQQINGLDHEEIGAWLKNALCAREMLPKSTPDEFPHRAILRLERELSPATRDSLRDNCLRFVREFCVNGNGDPAYLEELFSLTAAFNIQEATLALAQFASRLPEIKNITMRVKLAALSSLADMTPPQPYNFWNKILKQDPEHYSGVALSGALATAPFEALSMLPFMPRTKRAGQVAALKLDLSWDDLPSKMRSQFIEKIKMAVAFCNPNFAEPIETWVLSKDEPHHITINIVLRDALTEFYKGNVTPISHNSKLSAKREVKLLKYA